ncbi:MAG: helix-turn-helix domain-containing protein, partial [Mesorhizobium sp.]
AVSDWFIHTGIRQAEAPQQLDPIRRYDLRHPALVAMVQLMTSHIADPLKLDDLVHLSGIGMRQLERLATEQLGQSVMQFYRSLRLEKADEILQQSNLPLVEVALATGFSNRSHFSRAFQAHFGVGPATHRKQRRHSENYHARTHFGGRSSVD